jgi:hypothetical protein
MSAIEYEFAHSKDETPFYHFSGDGLPAYAQANDEWGRWVTAALNFCHESCDMAPELGQAVYEEVVRQVRQRIEDLYAYGSGWYDETPEELGLPSYDEFEKFVEANPVTDSEVIDWAIENYDENRFKLRAAELRLKWMQEEVERLRPTPQVR